MTNLLRAKLLIILSDVDGLYDGPPQEPSKSDCPDRLADRRNDCRVRARSGDGHQQGRNGQQAQAARMATFAGENVILANGREPDVLVRLVAGELARHRFSGPGQERQPLETLDRLLRPAPRDADMDDGACQAVTRQGRSLLAIGIVAVDGDFTKATSSRSVAGPVANGPAA